MHNYTLRETVLYEALLANFPISCRRYVNKMASFEIPLAAVKFCHGLCSTTFASEPVAIYKCSRDKDVFTAVTNS